MLSHLKLLFKFAFKLSGRKHSSSSTVTLAEGYLKYCQWINIPSYFHLIFNANIVATITCAPKKAITVLLFCHFVIFQFERAKKLLQNNIFQYTFPSIFHFIVTANEVTSNSLARLIFFLTAVKRNYAIVIFANFPY